MARFVRRRVERVGASTVLTSSAERGRFTPRRVAAPSLSESSITMGSSGRRDVPGAARVAGRAAGPDGAVGARSFPFARAVGAAATGAGGGGAGRA